MTAIINNKSVLNKIKSLRKEKHSQGLPFMINSDDLPSYQCYLEFPDGTIKIAEANSKESGFIIIEELDFLNAELIKRNLKLV